MPTRREALAALASAAAVPLIAGCGRDEQQGPVSAAGTRLAAADAASEAGALTSLDAKPLIVLTAEQGNAPGWIEKQAAIASLSTNSRHEVVPGATHQSLVDNPAHAAVVNKAIVDVVEAIRTGTPLPSP